MSLPRPVPGMVLRYAFLWSDEASAGRVESRKDRPCVVVLAAVRRSDGRVQLRVVPITHSPKSADRGLAIPAHVRRQLGLGAEEGWIVLDEANDFIWPGPDLRPVARERPGVWTFCVLPKEVFAELRTRLAGLVRQQLTKRSE